MTREVYTLYTICYQRKKAWMSSYCPSNAISESLETQEKNIMNEASDRMEAITLSLSENRRRKVQDLDRLHGRSTSYNSTKYRMRGGSQIQFCYVPAPAALDLTYGVWAYQELLHGTDPRRISIRIASSKSL